jgi:hypothetical protein
VRLCPPGRTFSDTDQLTRLLLTSSLDAVVSAPLIPIRAPINGRVRIGEAVAPGGAVHAGQILFTLADDQVDERALVDVQARLATIGEAAQTNARRMTVLKGKQFILQQRASLYRDATVQRPAAMLAEAEAAHGSAQIQLSLSRIELARTRDLAARGVQSRARLGEAETVAGRAAFEVERLGTHTEQLQAELGSARRGVVIGDGFADAPYSLQRLDEMTMRVSDLTTEQNALGRTRRELTERLAAEEETPHAAARGGRDKLRGRPGLEPGRGRRGPGVARRRAGRIRRLQPYLRRGDAARARLRGGTAGRHGPRAALERHGGAARHGALAPRRWGRRHDELRAASIEQVRSGLMTVVVDVDPAALARHSAGACQLGRSSKVCWELRRSNLRRLSG